jgi:hypothetical protein
MFFRTTKSARRTPAPKRYLRRSVLVAVGYILSPLSWWNDMVVNVPLAYAFSIPFALIHDGLFLPAFILGYWLTNLLGFLLIHKGVVGPANANSSRVSLRRHVAIAIVYTLVIVVMVWLKWIPMPAELLEMMGSSLES